MTKSSSSTAKMIGTILLIFAVLNFVFAVYQYINRADLNQFFASVGISFSNILFAVSFFVSNKARFYFAGVGVLVIFLAAMFKIMSSPPEPLEGIFSFVVGCVAILVIFNVSRRTDQK